MWEKNTTNKLDANELFSIIMYIIFYELGKLFYAVRFCKNNYENMRIR